MGNDEIERAMRSVIGNDERATRLRRDQSWVTTTLMRSVLGGSVTLSLSLSLSLSLFAHLRPENGL